MASTAPSRAPDGRRNGRPAPPRNSQELRTYARDRLIESRLTPNAISLMVSYTRARAEALGVECKVGIATRPVRVVLLSIGLIFAKGAGIGDFELLAPAIYVIAGLTIFTVFQRVWHVRNELTRMDAKAAEAGESGAEGL